MITQDIPKENAEPMHIEAFLDQIKKKSDRLTNYFLAGYFIMGLCLAPFYDTWMVAFCVGGLSLVAYYSAKFLLPKSTLYQYVLSTVLGIFMAQFIYQMHGLFEMHFVAFIGSAMLITYQNWKLQLPLVLVVVIHHALFGYLQYTGNSQVYFTQLEYMDLQTFIFHVLLAAVIFFICGLWAHHFKKYSERHIEQTFEMGRLQQEESQNEKLRKTNMELDKFVYSVSHDLRAPLLSMQGVMDLTELETNEEKTKEHMIMLKQSVQKLDNFISDILNYSRNSRLKVKQEEIDFKKLLSGITEQLAYMGGTKPIDVKINVEENGAFYSDKYRLSVVINNLISNAIRYQNFEAEYPYVNVHVTTDGNEAVINVEDNGIGINKENHQKIFEMFYRVSEKSNGSGIGLYIVKETVDTLKGKINIESEPGKGSKFSLRIPNGLFQ